MKKNSHGGPRPGAGRKSKLSHAIKTHLEAHYGQLSKRRVITLLAKEEGIAPRSIYNFGQYRGIMGKKPQKK